MNLELVKNSRGQFVGVQRVCTCCLALFQLPWIPGVKMYRKHHRVWWCTGMEWETVSFRPCWTPKWHRWWSSFFFFLEFFKRRHKPCIQLTFIVVKKRINTRFFVNEASTNPPPGTVVDQVVTREEWYDFYIVSQTSQDGTVTPTHYNVIYDTKGLYPDQVQCLTYKLCHMYYNLPVSFFFKFISLCCFKTDQFGTFQLVAMKIYTWRK